MNRLIRPALMRGFPMLPRGGTSGRDRKSVAAKVLPVALLACVGLSACGGSSVSTTTSATANPSAISAQATGAGTTSTTSTGALTRTTPVRSKPQPTAAASARHFAVVRECLLKYGIILPRRPPGSGRGVGEGSQLPKGMTREQFRAALVKCGGGSRAVGGSGGRPALSSPRLRQALVSFVACLRQDGIDMPAPNTSGKGPIFSTKGIDVRSPQFKKAELKCRAVLHAG
jgi:hypothetical protein